MKRTGKAKNTGPKKDRAYKRALDGIRATVRGEQPIKPADPFLLRDVVTILLDCGLRPEECYRLKWENIRDGGVEVVKGKRKASRRRVPASARLLAILEMRKTSNANEWIFPSATKSGHIESSTLKKQHHAALTASGVSPFVIYDLRHTCLTRWAKSMDPFTLMKLTGHADLNTTMRYVHLNDDDVGRLWQRRDRQKVGTKLGTAPKTELPNDPSKVPYSIDRTRDKWSWRRELNPRPSDYKSDALPTELRQHLTKSK